MNNQNIHNAGKLCYAMTRKRPEEFIKKEANWLAGKESFSDGINVRVITNSARRGVTVVIKDKKPLFKHINSSFLCAAGILESRGRTGVHEIKNFYKNLSKMKIYVGKTENNGEFIELTKNNKNLFNIQVKKNPRLFDFDVKFNKDINLDNSQLVIPVEETLENIALIALPEEKFLEIAKYGFGKLKVSEKVLNGIEKVLHKSHIGEGLKIHHGVEIVEGINEETEEFNHEKHKNYEKVSPISHPLQKPQENKQSDIIKSLSVKKQHHKSPVKESYPKNIEQKSAIDKSLESLKKGKKPSIKTIENATQQIKEETEYLEKSCSESEDTYESIIEKIGNDKFTKLLKLYATRIAFDIFRKSLENNHKKSDEEFIQEGYSSHVNKLYQSMIPPTPMSLLYYQRTTHQTLSPYWNLYDRFELFDNYIKDYKALEKDLSNRLSTRKNLLDKAEHHKETLLAHDQAIHQTYHDLLKKRKSVLANITFINESLEYLGPLLVSEFPSLEFVMDKANDLQQILDTHDAKENAYFKKEYQNSLSKAEQNHYQLGRRIGSLEQDIGFLNERKMQQRISLLNNSESASPLEMYDLLIQTHQTLEEELENDANTISNLRKQINFNQQMANSLYNQANGKDTAHNKKHHKDRVVEAVNDRIEADGLVNNNINLKREVQVRQENFNTKKKTTEDYGNTIDHKKTTKNIDDFYYTLVKKEIENQLGKDDENSNIRKAALKGFLNYRFSKDQRLNIVNQGFLSSENLLRELSMIAAMCEQGGIAHYGQKTQMLISMGRNIYNIVDFYSTWNHGNALLNTTLSTIREANPSCTKIDAIKALGPIVFASVYLVPGLQMLTTSLTLVRQGYYLFKGAKREDNPFLQLHEQIINVSKQIQQSSKGLHKQLNFNHEETKLLITNVCTQIEEMHSNVLKEIENAKNKIIENIQDSKNLQYAQTINAKSDKIKLKINQLSERLNNSKTDQESSQHLDKLLNYFKTQINLPCQDSLRGIITTRSSFGKKEKKACVSTSTATRFPEIFSGVIALQSGFSENIPSVKLLLIIIECYLSSLRSLPDNISEEQHEALIDIENTIVYQCEIIVDFIKFIPEYALQVHNQQIKLLTSWNKRINLRELSKKCIENNLIQLILEQKKFSREPSGKKRFAISNMLQKTSLYPNEEDKNSGWSEAGKASGAVGAGVVAGAGAAIATKTLVMSTVSIIVAGSALTVSLPLIAGLALFAPVPLAYTAYKGGKKLNEVIKRPTKKQVEELKKIRPSNFMEGVENLKPLKNKKIIQIDFWIEKDGTPNYSFLRKQKLVEEDVKKVYPFCATALIDKDGVDTTHQNRESIISIEDASRLEAASCPVNLDSYDTEIQKLFDSYLSLVEEILECGDKESNSTTILASSTPSLIPLLFPKEVLDYCEKAMTYEKAVISIEGQGNLVPMYTFEKQEGAYVLKINYHHIHSQEKTEIIGFEILEIDEVTVQSFTNATFEEENPVVNLNECLLQLMYAQLFDCPLLGIPGSDSVIFPNTHWIAPSERFFPSFYTLLYKKPHEKITFNHRDYTEEVSLQLKNYAHNQTNINPLSVSRIKACALEGGYRFQRTTKNLMETLKKEKKELQKNYDCLKACFCLATSMSDIEIDIILEKELGIVDPTHTDYILQKLHLKEISFEEDEGLIETARYYFNAFPSDAIKQIKAM